MKLEDLERAVREHSGEFHCELIGKRKKAKVVRFSHLVIPPGCTESIPDVGRLRDFYNTFGSVVLYYDEKSGDAARHISSPSEWAELHAEFSDWLDMVDDEDDEDALPQWAKNCLVIGEVPQSGNYILMATEGAEAGQVFEFDHDGFEFTEGGPDVVAYVERLLKPDDAALTAIASHMRFMEDDSDEQWWIRAFRDNRGHTAKTEV